ncbi:MAG: Asp-tRNA(Asn)/Glu-tRNA(Gln) amidotransferase subunit GatC [Pseudomonadota bacterium]
MSVDAATVRKIAHLARIRLRDDEVAPLQGELNNILAWVEQLAAVDTGDIAPMACVIDATLVQRRDEVSDGGYADKVLGNAPRAEYGFFAVPKVIE